MCPIGVCPQGGGARGLFVPLGGAHHRVSAIGASVCFSLLQAAGGASNAAFDGNVANQGGAEDHRLLRSDAVLRAWWIGFGGVSHES